MTESNTITPLYHESEQSTQSTVENRGLNPKHYAELIGKRKLSPEWVLASCRSIGLEEASDLLGYSAKSSGILIQGDGYQQQFKPDIPWASEEQVAEGKKKPKKPKYRTPLNPPGSGYDAILPSHPTEKDYWWSLEKLKERCYQAEIDGKIVSFLIVTEGGFKAICGCSNELPTVGLLGVENGLTSSKDDVQGKRYLIPSLERFAKAEFGFIIAFDADCAENVKVQQASWKLEAQLQKFNVPVIEMTGTWSIEEGKGMDDFIANHGIEAFRERLDQMFRDRAESDEWIGKNSGSYGEKKKATLPPANVISAEIAEIYRDQLAWESEYQLWRHYGAESDGLWSVQTTESVRGIIHSHLRCLPGNPGFSSGFVSSVLSILQSDLEAKKWNETPDLIPLIDGVLDRKTLQLHPHNPGYRFTWQLPYKWEDSNIGCAPIEDFLLKVTGNPLIAEVILCYLKAIVTRRSDLQRYLELIGGGGTGKSTLMKLALALAGESNSVSSQLKYLEGNQFESAKLYRKILTLLPDSERWQGEVSVLKQITGQDPIRYERKGVQQCSSFVYEGMVILSANEPPESSDRTSGLERRKLTIEFNRRIPEYEGRELSKEFEPYLPGLLKKILTIPDERVTQLVRFTEKYCPALANKKWSQLTQTNSIAAWLDDNCCINSELKGYMGVDNPEKSGQWLYANFCQYLRESGHRGVIPIKRFSANLRDLLKNQMKVVITEGRDRHGSYIEGIGLRCFYDPSWQSYPSPLAGKRDGCVMDGDGSVTAGTLGSDGCDGYAGFFETPKFEEKNPENSLPPQSSIENTTPPDPKPSDLEVRSQRNLAPCENPQNPSHPSLPRLSAVTDPSQIHHTSVTNPPEADFSSYPHLTSDDVRAKVNEATKIQNELLGATTKDQLVAIKDKWGERCKWVWKHLSKAEKAKVKAIAQTEQLKIDLSSAAEVDTLGGGEDEWEERF